MLFAFHVPGSERQQVGRVALQIIDMGVSARAASCRCNNERPRTAGSVGWRKISGACMHAWRMDSVWRMHVHGVSAITMMIMSHTREGS